MQQKEAKVTKQVAQAKKKEEMQDSFKNYFGERDKTNRGVEGKMEEITADSAILLEIQENLYRDSLKLTPLPPGVEPVFSEVFLSARRSKVTTAGGILIAQEGNLDCDYEDIQVVMAIGPQIKDIPTGLRPGWEVKINLEHFRTFDAAESGSMADKVNRTKSLKLPIERIDNNEYMLMSDRSIKYVVSKNIKN